jgi:thiamine biosynthesis lipoprotein
MSTWRDDSEISRFNAASTVSWFPVSAELADIVQRAQQISRSTHGAFDITVGPLVRLWGFGPDKAVARIPDQDEIDSLLQSTGADSLQVRTDPPSLRKLNPTTEIDVSAIAKGYAVDRIVDRLEALGIHSYMVEIGGEIRANGRKDDGGFWRIGISQPIPGDDGFAKIVELDGQAIATSGDYRNFFVLEGERYAHVIDPRTGWPVAHELASVSIRADDCAFADAMATAMLVMGPTEGMNHAQENGLSVLLFIREGDHLETWSTAGFGQANDSPRPQD